LGIEGDEQNFIEAGDQPAPVVEAKPAGGFGSFGKMPAIPKIEAPSAA
jgi:hypothetical protein